MLTVHVDAEILTAMHHFTLAELESARDVDLGISDWLTIEQERINLFAEATGDHAWIHVDPERAAGGPFRGTIAHGFMGLSLLPLLLDQFLLKVTDAPFGLNYGVDRVRFTTPVPVGARVRARVTIASAERKAVGLLVRMPSVLELEHSDKPAVVAEMLGMFFE